MNELATRIGALNTHYVNTTGLDQEGAYSTVYDQALILDYALKNPIFKTVYTTKNYTLTNGLEVEATINKYNKLLNLDTSKIIGSKTGNTTNAGLCMSALFYHEDHEMILITLGAELVEDVPYNLLDALTLIDTVHENYEIPIEEEVVKEINVNPIDTSITIHYEFVISIVIIILLIISFLCHKTKKR